MDNNGFGIIIVVVFILFFVAAIVGLVFLSKKSKEQEQQSEMRINQMAMGLPQERATVFMMQYQNARKDPTTAVILALFLGGLGVHKFYLNKIGLGILYLLFCWTSIPSWIALIEAFTLAGQVAKVNEQKAQAIVAGLRY